MRRRTFIAGLLVATAAGRAHAQQPAKLPTIGFLGTTTPSVWKDYVPAFVQRLRELGWVEGRTVAIEYRWAEGRNERFGEIAAEFARLKVDVIVTSGGAGVAAKQATSTIPIVLALANDPVGSGLAASLARPGVIKYEGYRLQIHLDKGRVTIRTQTGLDWTKRFSALAAAFDIPVDRAIFDGEVATVKDGRTNFSELKAALAAGRQEALTFNVFDLLFLEGFDLRHSPLSERKRILKELLEETGVSGPILYADHLVSDGPRLLAHACKLGFEGIISKKADPRTGRNAATRGSRSVACNGRSFRLWDS